MILKKVLTDFPIDLRFWAAKNLLGYRSGRLDFLKVLCKGVANGLMVRTSPMATTQKGQVVGLALILTPTLTLPE